MSVKPIPDNYPTVMPYLIVKGASAALEFYKSVFGAVEMMRMAGPDGTVMHAEIKIGNSVIMLGEENPQWGAKGPGSFGGSPVGLCVYCVDVDARVEAAVVAGAGILKPVRDQFYGDRSGTITDPFGHHWTVATHIEDVSVEEMSRRHEEMMQKSAA